MNRLLDHCEWVGDTPKVYIHQQHTYMYAECIYDKQYRGNKASLAVFNGKLDAGKNPAMPNMGENLHPS